MSELRWMHLNKDVVQPWAELTNLLAKVDGTEEYYEPEDLAEELEETGMDPAQDTWTVWDGDRLVAFGQLRVGFTTQEDDTVRCQLDGGVHPDWRRRGIGRELMDKMEQRARDLNQERNPGLPGTLRAGGGLEGSSARSMLHARGYEEARYFILMERPMPGDPLEVDWEEFASPTVEDEEAVRIAHNAAFEDHWGTAPMTPERWHDFYAGRPMRPQFSSISRRDDGAVNAYVLISQYLDDELYVDLVGTIREARGTGLASRAMARSIELARGAEGIKVLGLDVDSESPTGATRVYERLGFVEKHVTAAMTRPL